MKVVFSVAGDKQIERELLRWNDRALDAQPAFEAIGEFLIAETELQFETEGKHASGGWKPLKRATVAAKRRKGLRLQILQATGTLRATLTERGTPGMIFETTPTGLRFGSHVPYAEFHQTGTRTMPRRRPIELTEATRRTVVKMLQAYIVKGAAAV